MLTDEVLRYYESIGLPYPQLIKIGTQRWKVTPFAIQTAMNRLYQERDKFPQISIGHRVFLTARSVPAFPPEEPKKSPWWKRLLSEVYGGKDSLKWKWFA